MKTWKNQKNHQNQHTVWSFLGITMEWWNEEYDGAGYLSKLSKKNVNTIYINVSRN